MGETNIGQRTKISSAQSTIVIVVAWSPIAKPRLEPGATATTKLVTMTTLLLVKDKWISASGDAAALHVVGTAQKPITIFGVEKTPGYWHALVYGGSLNAANAIEYATIGYGGGGGGGEQGMILANSDSHGVVLSVKSSRVRGSGQYGIWLGHSLTAFRSSAKRSSTTYA